MVPPPAISGRSSAVAFKDNVNAALGNSASSASAAPGTLPSGTHLFGFVAWIAIHIAYTLFLLWAHLPANVLRSLGVTYHPDHHWALALPCYAFVTAGSAVVFYASHNIMSLRDLSCTSTIVDEHTRIPEERELAGWGHDEQIHDAIDLPISFVSRVMHGGPPLGLKERAGPSSMREAWRG